MSIKENVKTYIRVEKKIITYDNTLVYFPVSPFTEYYAWVLSLFQQFLDQDLGKLGDGIAIIRLHVCTICKPGFQCSTKAPSILQHSLCQHNFHSYGTYANLCKYYANILLLQNFQEMHPFPINIFVCDVVQYLCGTFRIEFQEQNYWVKSCKCVLKFLFTFAKMPSLRVDPSTSHRQLLFCCVFDSFGVFVLIFKIVLSTFMLF